MIKGWILKVRRAETPGFKRLKAIARSLLYSSFPAPRFTLPFFRLLYSLRFGIAAAWNHLLSYFFRSPAFRARCEQCGRGLYVCRTPEAPNHTKIYLGDEVQFFGKTAIFSAPIFDTAELVLGDRVDVGHMVTFMASKRIEIGSDTNIANRVTIADNDNHPRDAELRIAGGAPEADEVRPVKIGSKVWLGMSAFIGKGVTIGDGAIVAANSVVLTDVPAYCVVLGNPARVIVKNLDARYNAEQSNKPGGNDAKPVAANQS
jgi:acetyltransferase-like isoleucine patch superfamily enzyme